METLCPKRNNYNKLIWGSSWKPYILENNYNKLICGSGWKFLRRRKQNGFSTKAKDNFFSCSGGTSHLPNLVSIIWTHFCIQRLRTSFLHIGVALEVWGVELEVSGMTYFREFPTYRELLKIYTKLPENRNRNGNFISWFSLRNFG